MQFVCTSRQPEYPNIIYIILYYIIYLLYITMVNCNLHCIQFVCLFVRDSRLNYAKNSHQSLRNYRDPLGRMTPRIGVTRPVVSMAFSVYFRYLLRGRPPYFNYGLVAFPFFTSVLLHAAGGVRNINQ